MLCIYIDTYYTCIYPVPNTFSLYCNTNVWWTEPSSYIHHHPLWPRRSLFPKKTPKEKPPRISQNNIQQIFQIPKMKCFFCINIFCCSFGCFIENISTIISVSQCYNSSTRQSGKHSESPVGLFERTSRVPKIAKWAAWPSSVHLRSYELSHIKRNLTKNG